MTNNCPIVLAPVTSRHVAPRCAVLRTINRATSSNILPGAPSVRVVPFVRGTTRRASPTALWSPRGCRPHYFFLSPSPSFSDLYLFHLVDVAPQMCGALSAARLLAGDEWHPYPAPFPLSMVTVPPLAIHIKGLTVLKPSPSIANNTVSHHCPPSSTTLVPPPAVFGSSRVASCH